MAITEVILVNEQDEVVGRCEKMEAHQKPVLHRAFSVFIFNQKGEMLLQQRAVEKYHSGGLWTNACCSHPMPNEETKVAGLRRLEEELGFTTEIQKVFDFIYKADFDNGLTEFEFDHVFVGEYDGPIVYNKEEVMNISYQTMSSIKQSLLTEPSNYTAWFHHAFPKIEDWWNQRYSDKDINFATV